MEKKRSSCPHIVLSFVFMTSYKTNKQTNRSIKWNFTQPVLAPMSFYIDPYYVASGWTAGRTHNPKDFPFISNQVESKEQNWLSFSCFSLRRFLSRMRDNCDKLVRSSQMCSHCSRTTKVQGKKSEEGPLLSTFFSLIFSSLSSFHSGSEGWPLS